MLYVLNGHETSRLIFRLVESSDFDDWLELFKVPSVARFLAFDPKLPPKELCQVWFDKVFHRYENNLGGMNVLVDKEINKMIGQCGLLVQEVDGKKELEIGYSILPHYWNMGYASEASQYCKQVALNEKYAESLVSVVHVDNIASQKVALKNGMSLDKTIDYKGIPAHVFRVRNFEVV